MYISQKRCTNYNCFNFAAQPKRHSHVMWFNDGTVVQTSVLFNCTNLKSTLDPVVIFTSLTKAFFFTAGFVHSGGALRAGSTKLRGTPSAVCTNLTGHTLCLSPVPARWTV